MVRMVTMNLGFPVRIFYDESNLISNKGSLAALSKQILQ